MDFEVDSSIVVHSDVITGELVEDFTSAEGWVAASDTDMSLINDTLALAQDTPAVLDMAKTAIDLSAYTAVSSRVVVSDIAAGAKLTLAVVDGDAVEHTDATPVGETGIFNLVVDLSTATNLATSIIELRTEIPTVLDVVVRPVRGLF